MKSPDSSLFNGVSVHFDGLLKNARLNGANAEEEAEAAVEEERRKRQLQTEMMDAFADLSEDGDEFGCTDVSTDPSFHPDQIPSSTPYVATLAAADDHPSLYDELAGSYHFEDGSDACLQPEETLKGATDLGETPARHRISSSDVPTAPQALPAQHQHYQPFQYQHTNSHATHRLPPLAEGLEISYTSHPQNESAVPALRTGKIGGNVGDDVDCYPVRGSPRDLAQLETIPSNIDPVTTTNKEPSNFSVEQLMIISDARGREVERLRAELEQVRQENGDKVRQLEHRLTLSTADRQVLDSCQQQSKQLLVQKDSELATLRGEFESVRVLLKVSEETREKLIGELNSAETTVSTLQRQLSEMQRAECVARDANMHREVIDTLKRQHEQQLTAKQARLDDALAQLTEKTSTVTKLSTELSNAVDAKQRAVADKSAIISQLSSSLEMSQRQCQQLLSADAGRLRVQLDEERQRRNSADARLAEMQTELETCRRDLETCESILGLQTDNLLSDGASRNNAHPQSLMVPRDDLVRSMENGRRHREEAANLRRQLDQKEHELRDAHKLILEKDLAAQSVKNKDSAIQTETSTEDVNLLRSKLDEALLTADSLRKNLNELIQERDKLSSSVCELNQRLSEQILEADRERVEAVENVRQSCIRLHDDVVNKLRTEKIQSYENNISSLENKIAKLESDINEVKSLYIDVCQEKMSLSEKVISLEKMNEHIQEKAVEKALIDQRKLLNIDNIKTSDVPLQNVGIQTDISGTALQAWKDNGKEVAKLESMLKCCQTEKKELELKIKDLSVVVIRKSTDSPNDDGESQGSSDNQLATILKTRLDEVNTRLCSAYEEFDKEKQELMAVYEEKIRLVLDQNNNTLESQKKLNELSLQCQQLRDELKKQRSNHREILQQREEAYNRTLNSYYTLMKTKVQELKEMERNLRTKLSTGNKQHMLGHDSKWLIDENQRLSAICSNVVDAIQREREKCQSNLETLETNENVNSQLRQSLIECRADCERFSELARRSKEELFLVRNRYNTARDKMRAYHETVKQREEYYRSELLRLESSYREAVASLKDHLSVCTVRLPGKEISRGVQTDVTGEDFNRAARGVFEYHERIAEMKAAMTETLDQMKKVNYKAFKTDRIVPVSLCRDLHYTHASTNYSSRGNHVDLNRVTNQVPDHSSRLPAVVNSLHADTETFRPTSTLTSSEPVAARAEQLNSRLHERSASRRVPLDDPLLAMERIRKDIEYIFANGPRHTPDDDFELDGGLDDSQATTPPSKDTQGRI